MKKAISFLVAVMMTLSLAVPAFGAQEATVTPRYTNAQQVRITFAINQNGNATVVVKCIGNSNVSHVRIVTYLERYVNGGWVRVDIGTTNNQWVYSALDSGATISYSPKLTVKGEYRASTIITLTATTVEVIRLDATDTY